MECVEHGEKLKSVLRLESDIAKLKEKVALQETLVEAELKSEENTIYNIKQEQTSQVNRLRQEKAALQQVVQELHSKSEVERERLRSQYEGEVTELREQNKLNEKRDILQAKWKELEEQTNELQRLWDNLKEQSDEILESEAYFARRQEILTHKKEELQQQEQDLLSRKEEVANALKTPPRTGGVSAVLKPKTDELLTLKEQLLATQLQKQNKEQLIRHLQQTLLVSEKENEELEALHSHFQQHLQLALGQINQYRDSKSFGDKRPSRHRSETTTGAVSSIPTTQQQKSSTGKRRFRRESTREQLRSSALQEDIIESSQHEHLKRSNSAHSSTTCSVM
ncbi:golgin subfamily A member 6-like protein 22 [Corticium candelabrum]|uniref:golgin subfamily A member 6-like protein 22 n=1 Tax=Corticium candelabrum TaxID=121492 RepID=UPI002E35DDCB|nr:golgin subfamily A member 6-like protein 22 [Corticium candelabrum]